MARENQTVTLAERPKGDVEIGKTFKLEKGPAPTADQLKDGEILVEALYLSLDPAMRGWLNGASPLSSPSPAPLAPFVVVCVPYNSGRSCACCRPAARNLPTACRSRR